MRIERVTLRNFRCFGPDPVSIDLSPGITAFIGANGSGKTAVLQALSRLFGVTNDQRRIRRQDFHVPQDEDSQPAERSLSVEVLLDFPELGDSNGSNGDDTDTSAVPEFFHQMAVGDQGSLKCRLRFDAVWTDDGSVEGAVEPRFRAVRTLDADFDEAACSNITTADRTRIQMVYVPSARDGESQVAAFLRGRLWRAISWSDEFQQVVMQSGKDINEEFGQQLGVGAVGEAVRRRWEGLAGAHVQETPNFRPIDQRFEEFIRRVEVSFEPGEAGRALELAELGDGQRSLFHIAMTLAAIDVEARIRAKEAGGFINDRIHPPALTLVAVEEPENNLAPFFLSHIISEVQRLTADSQHAQALISSHSASLLGRVRPDDVRHFRLSAPARTSLVRPIVLPSEPETESKFVREAVGKYPELYFARFVILGEGASEEVVIPRIAAAHGLHIDRSFVAVVPLGGRHVNHLWKLLAGLDIPHATLLDLDAARAGGGWGRIKNACVQLLENGISADELFGDDLQGREVAVAVAAFDSLPLDRSIRDWIQHLRKFDVFFAGPLDLDMMMLQAFPDDYKTLTDGRTGPREGAESEARAAAAVLGEGGQPNLYPKATSALFPWYRYLFLGRSKPDSHLWALSRASDQTLRDGAPEVLLALLDRVRDALVSEPGEASVSGPYAEP